MAKVTFGSLKPIVLLVSFVCEITAGERLPLNGCSVAGPGLAEVTPAGASVSPKPLLIDSWLCSQCARINPRTRKVNSQTHTVLQLRLHFQSPLLADHIPPVSTLPHSWYSPAHHAHCSALVSPVKHHLLHSCKQLITLLLWYKTQETAKPITQGSLSRNW